MSYELFKKDCVIIYLLNEIVNEKTSGIEVYLESDGAERNFLSIRKEGMDTYQFNNFLVSEIPSENCIMFKPNVVGCPAYVMVTSDKDIKIDVIRNGATEVDRSFPMLAGEVKIEFAPENYTKYNLFVNQRMTAYDSQEIQTMATGAQHQLHELQDDTKSLLENISAVNTEIETQKLKKEQLTNEKNTLSAEHSELAENVKSLSGDIEKIEADKQKLTDDKAKLIDKLDKIKAEYDKDYESYRDEIEEIKRNYDVDAEILKYYEDKDVTAIEELIENAKKDIERIEEQIRIFVDAKARKTAEIESELKLGKKE